jgi:hypothetical protein
MRSHTDLQRRTLKDHNHELSEELLSGVLGHIPKLWYTDRIFPIKPTNHSGGRIRKHFALPRRGWRYALLPFEVFPKTATLQICDRQSTPFAERPMLYYSEVAASTEAFVCNCKWRIKDTN